MPRCSVPNTSSIAPTGQAILHAPWPIQLAGPTSRALPRIIPSTGCASCSGQAARQDRQPIHLLVSITGCRDGGSVKLAAIASAAVRNAVCSFLYLERKYQAKIKIIGVTYKVIAIGLMLVLHGLAFGHAINDCHKLNAISLNFTPQYLIAKLLDLLRQVPNSIHSH